jgi:uncharacterized protein (TIGR02246 family)
MKFFSTIITMVILSACGRSKPDKLTESKNLMNLSREWSSVAGTKNLEKTLSYWADDAVLISAGQPALNGKQAIRKMVEESFKTPGFRISWEPQSVEISETGDMAYLIEKSNITFNDSTGHPVTMSNTGVTIWRKQEDGSWKNVVDISTPTK